MNKHITHNAWMKITTAISEFSTCRIKIGAIIIKSNMIVGTGYVGSISQDKHCNDTECLLVDNYNTYGSSALGKSCIRTIHAEANAVLKCIERGNNIDGWLISYCTYQPCLNCIKLLLSIGVRKIYYYYPYTDLHRDYYLKNCNITLLIKQIENV